MTTRWRRDPVGILPEAKEAVPVDVAASIQERFKCSKCGNDQARVKELAMTGTGLSKLFDIQHNHYLFVSCLHCGYTEVYDPRILGGKRGTLSTILDVLFGG